MNCALCGKAASMRCSTCKAVHYCSVDCQKEHWPQHKRTHVLTIKYPFKNGKINAKTVIDAFNCHGYIIIKLSNAADVDLMVRFRQAAQQLFAQRPNEKSLPVQEDWKFDPKKDTVGYMMSSTGYESIDFRTESTFTKLYPDPDTLVKGFTDRFMKMYHFCADISDGLIFPILATNKRLYVSDISRPGGAHVGLVRVLNYLRSGNALRPHVDSGYITLSPRGTSPGLMIKNPITGQFTYPETTMHADDELLAIPNMDLAGLSLNAVKATVHAVKISHPRQSMVINARSMFTQMTEMDFADDTDEEIEVMKSMFGINKPRSMP